MSEEKQRAGGYHGGDVSTVLSVEAVTQQAAAIAQHVDVASLEALAGNDPYLSLENLHAGYGRMEILHGINL
ncbi:MAG: ABC transporter ATP-binding protein, partial [Pseudomonadota bacterium]